MPPDQIYVHIGALIKKRRNFLKLKQESLAHLLRISRGSLANIEIGRQSVLVHQIYKFAKVLQLSPFDLLPQPVTEESSAGRTELPMPNDLNSQQKKQVANFYSQGAIKQMPNTESTHAKRNKD